MKLIRTDDGTLMVEVEAGEKKREHSSYAAWYTDHELTAGQYPVESEISGGVRHYFARIPSVVVDEYYAPHFGGVAVGPSRKDCVGKPATYYRSWYDSYYLNCSLEASGLPHIERNAAP